MMTVKVSQKGWVVIPAELRKKYHLEAGDEVVFVDYGGILAIYPALKDPIHQLHGMFKDGPSLTEALIEERKIEYQREERRMSRSNDPS
jgi:AbrB family looped-hinge helix DNA binding protein